MPQRSVTISRGETVGASTLVARVGAKVVLSCDIPDELDPEEFAEVMRLWVAVRADRFVAAIPLREPAHPPAVVERRLTLV